MKSVFAALMFGSMTILALPSSAQRVKLAEGDLKPLAGQKEINLEFVYSDMKVGKMSEADYVKKKKDEYNKKEAGKGDAWEKAWMEDRETRYEPRFIQSFTQFSGMTGGPIASAKYTAIVKTVFVEPGYNIAITRKNAEVNLEILIVETANKSHVIGKITCDKSPGGSFWENDFDTGERIAEAYKNAGMSVGGLIRSKAN
ncbi:MAG TPA: hypothetical protein PLQ32_10510 [Flavihumibacter sp.]|nr:hypothetical protein [Bacteroidota bacterium]HOA39458.1 hypothetical protein [Flavihumibacter sp.]HPZ88528.1 hypothetical protein [Flavihumibacter sp.]HQD09281.1 hypothetical protein [Flavihumibacter sp.]